MNNDMLPAGMTVTIKPEDITWNITWKGGDLINREALRNVILNDDKLDGANANWEVNRILVHIDKAQPVECPQFNIFCENADKQAIADMKAELQRVLNEIRPKGEWIDDSPTSWKCSCCGYGVNRWNNTPYCPNCGIKMQHTEKEQ